MENIIIAGAYGGIGKAAVANLSKDFKIIALGKDKDKLSELQKGASNIEIYQCDCSDFQKTEDIFSKISEDHGPIKGVINCIGNILLKPLHKTTYEDFQSVLQINIQSAFSVARAASIVMQKEGGSVVLFSSTAAKVGLPNHEVISAAKAAIIGLVQSSAATYANHRLRFNCIAPGLTETPLSAPLLSSDMMRKASQAMHPLGRVGKIDDIIPVIKWLVSDDSSWVTGQTIAVDGGISTVRGKLKV